MQVHQVPNDSLIVDLSNSQYVLSKVDNRYDELGQLEYCIVNIEYERRDGKWVKLTARQVGTIEHNRECTIVDEEYIND